jgi:aspartyl-tRNA(Asn)/glutamyl-tRNA(Gln) amidotransferase subunit A
VGPLAGVLVGVKDNLCTANMPSTGGSRILDGYRPAYDATAVRWLREAGAIVLGKTNLDEFGMGSTTEGSAFQVGGPEPDPHVV